MLSINFSLFVPLTLLAVALGLIKAYYSLEVVFLGDAFNINIYFKIGKGSKIESFVT